MGKTPRPLTIILTDAAMLDWPEIQALAKQGHSVMTMDEFTGMPDKGDLILGPHCWFMTGLHRQYLTSALKAARKRRYGKEDE